MSEFDVIIVGAGAGGAIVAAVLAESGKRVLLLERGRALSFEEVGRDHLRNHRLPIYGHNTGPSLEGNPRVFQSPNGAARIVDPHEPTYHNNAMTVGGGTRVFGAQAWRFHPKDFRMASAYGVPDGSSLADWPISYDHLEPFYEKAEWAIGVAGDSAPNRFQGPRQKPYPLPPSPTTLQRQVLGGGAAQLGIHTAPVPLLINTIRYQGRPACAQCGMCVGFACPTDAKNGSHNTMLPRALATGQCTLITEAIVDRVIVDYQGKATGVSYFVGDQHRQASARAVVLCAGAIETARLLLNSAIDESPRGLGNDHDQVGRHLQGHFYTGALGLFAQIVHDNIGPGVAISTCQWNHDNPGVIGGAMLANEFIKLPLLFQKWNWPPDVPRWGLAAKNWMRHAYPRTIHICGPVQEIPNPNSRVTIDPDVRDRWGIPVARLCGTVHSQTIATANFIRARAKDWLRASGAEKIWSYPPVLQLSAGQHQAGTCRMGDDPESSVTDKCGRLHHHDNIYCADGSLHPTNGGFNPVLTIMAMAFRIAEVVAGTV